MNSGQMKLDLVVTGQRERREQTDRWMKGFEERHLTDDSHRSVKSKSKTPKQSSDGPQPNGSPPI